MPEQVLADSHVDVDLVGGAGFGVPPVNGMPALRIWRSETMQARLIAFDTAPSTSPLTASATLSTV